jgi:hypothetical protein
MRTLEVGADWSMTKGRGAMGSHACAHFCLAGIAQTMATTRTNRLWSDIREVRCKDICSLLFSRSVSLWPNEAKDLIEVRELM